MKKKCILTLLVLMLLTAPLKFAAAQDMPSQTDLYEALYQSSEMSRLEFNDSESLLYRLTGYDTLGELIKATISGEYTFNFGVFLQIVKELLFGTLRENISLLIQILAVSILFEILLNSNASFLTDTVKNAVYYSLFLILAAKLSGVFFNAIETSSRLMSDVVSFLNNLLPILAILLVSAGGTLISGILSPSLLLLTNIITYLINNVILPAASFSFIVGIADKLTDSLNLSYLCDFIRKTSYFILGALFTVFIAVSGFEGYALASADSAAYKVAKYAAGTLIPVVGKFLSDSADTVAAFMGVIKNSIGFVGVIAVIMIVLSPILKIFAYYLTIRISSVIIQPFADKKLSAAIEAAAGSMLFVCVCMTTTAVMAVVMIAILVYFGNYLFMMR